MFGNSYKYYFANLNFNKNPMALNFYNTTYSRQQGRGRAHLPQGIRLHQIA
jgi:hypothetical protein